MTTKLKVPDDFYTCEFFEPASITWTNTPKACFYCVFWNYEKQFCFINDKDIRLIRFSQAAKNKNQKRLEREKA